MLPAMLMVMLPLRFIYSKPISVARTESENAKACDAPFGIGADHLNS